LLGNQLIALKTGLKRERIKHLSFLYGWCFRVAKLLLRGMSSFRNTPANSEGRTVGSGCPQCAVIAIIDLSDDHQWLIKILVRGMGREADGAFIKRMDHADNT
jgi:hypothetical protein